MKTRTSLILCALAVLGLVAVQPANAATIYTWDANGVLGASSGAWSNPVNWNPDAVPVFVAGDTFDLSTLNITGNSSSTVDANATLGIIKIGDLTTSSHSWALKSTGGAVITLDNISANSQINQTSTSFGDGITVPLALKGSLDITNLAAAKPLTISGGITSGAALGTQTISNLGAAAGGLIISGVIGDGISGGQIAITQNAASGALTLAGANTYTGVTTIAAGTLQAANATALGNGGDITFGGGTLQFTPLSAGQDWAARIKNSAAAIKIDTNNQNVTFAGIIPITNSGGLTKCGGGRLTLSGANVYTGTTAVSAGTLWAAQQASLPGQATLGAITVANGATLAVNAGGAGEFAGADIDNVVTNATFAATGTLAVDTTNAGAPVAVSAIIAPNHALTKFGAGTLTLTAANTYTAATTLYGGNLQLSGVNGATTGATPYTLAGGSLVIDNTTAAGGNNNLRISDGSTIVLNNGSFIYNGADAATTNSTETVGAISGFGGRSAVTVAFGGTNVATLTAASFGHSASNGAILVNGANLGMDNTSVASVGRFIVTTAPTLTGTTVALATGINAASQNTQVVPFLVGEATSATGGTGTATGTPNTFVTYIAGSGLRPLNPTDEFTNNAIAATNNIYITSATAAGATAAINSLAINGGSLSITDGRTLTNTSGALLFATTHGITSSTDGRLALGAEGMVTVNSGVTGTISVPITGTAGLTKSGAGNLTLSAAFNTNNGALTAEGGGTVTLGGNNFFNGDINVGSNSAGNTLNITGGGTEINTGTGANYLNIGYGVFGNNSVTISTPGNFASPSFKVHQLRLGESSSNNSLTVSNGAYYRLVTGNSGWTIGNNLGANNNSLTVTGAGTILTRLAASGSAITVGNSGSNNSLTVSAGGSVLPQRITVGGGAGGSNNSVVVTGANSFLYINSSSNSDWVQGGAAGASNNSTTISDQGRVFYGGTSRSFAVGYAVGADNNYLTVTGAGSLLTVYYSLPISIGGRGDGTDGGVGNYLNVVSGGSLVTSSTTSVYLLGTNSTFNLGNGMGVSTATVGASGSRVAGVYLKNGSSTLNVNSGRLTAVAGGAMVSGPGSMNLNGPAYVSTFFTNSSIDSAIAGTGSLTKEGPGSLTLSNAVNTYSGGTTVSSGTLVLSGANVVPGSGTVNVSGGGTLSMADGTARATTVGGLTLVNATAVALDWNAAAVDTLTTSTAAVTSGKVGIVLNPTNSPSGGPLTLISSPSGGLGGASYFLANNTNYTAILDTTTTPTTAITVGTYAAGTALTSAYWYGNQVAGTNTAGVDNAMAFSNGTKSNWSSAAAYTATGLVPGSAANVLFSTTDAGATQQSNIVLGAGMSVNTVTFNDTTPVTIAGDGSWLTLNSTGTGTSSAISTNQDATINANVLLPGAQVFTTAIGRTLTVGGNLTGAGSLSIGTATIGAGTVVLSGANTYLGSTTINAGTLKAGSTTALPPTSVLTIGSTGQIGTLDLAGYSNTVAGLATGGTAASQIITNSATGTAILTVNNDVLTNGSERSFTGVLQDGGPGKVLGLTKSGSGTLNLNAANTYSGGTIVNGTGDLLQGTLRVQTDASLGAVPTSPTVNVTLNGGALMNWNVAVALDPNRTISLGAGGGYMQAGWSSNLTVLGKVTGAGGLTILPDSGWVVLANGTNNYAGNTAIYSGAKLQLGTGLTGQNGAVGGTGIVDHGALAFNNFEAQSYSGTISGLGTLTKLGPGTLTLSGANTYLGATTVNAGTLRTGANDVLPMASSVTVSGNAAGVTATLDLAGNSDTIGPLTLGGSTTTSGAAVTTGVAGTLTLGGDVTYANANNPLGATIGGNLSLGSSLATLNRTFTVGDSATAVNDLTVSANISGTGVGLTKAGAGTLVLSGANTYTGATTVSVGTLSFANRASLYNDVQTNWTPTNITVESAAVLAVGVGDSPTYFDTTALDTLLNGTHMGQSTATTGLKTGAILGLDTTNATSGTFTRSTALANLSGGNVLNLAKVGAGELVLSGDNTYTGTTTVNAGKLTLSGNNVAATGNMAINNGGLAQFNSPASINGTARNVTVNSGGTVMFDTAFTAGSIPTALLGRIVAASAGAIAADNYDSTAFDFNTPGLTAASLGAVGTVNYTGTLTPNGTTYRLGGGGGTLTYGTTAIAGANALATSGPGTVILTYANTYTGTTTVNSGTVKAGVGSVAGVSGPFGNNSNVTLANTLGATLDLNGYDTQIGSLAGGGTTGGNVTLGAKTLTVGNTTNTTYSGVISSSAGVTGVSLNKIGSGRLNLQNANTYTGKTVIDGGTLFADETNGTLADAKLGAVPTTFQADNITIKNGGTLFLASGTDGRSLSANRGIYLDTGLQTINTGSGDFNMNPVISGPGGLFHGNTGAGGYRRLYLQAANTYTGDTKFDGSGSTSSYGGIEMSNALALQYSAFDTSSIGSKLGNPAALVLGGLVGTVNLAGLLNTPAMTSLTLQPQLAGVTKTYSGAIVGAAGMTLTLNGPGTQALNGANTYTGATTITNGVLSVNKIDQSGGNSSLGNNSLAVTLGGTSTLGTLSYTGGTASATRAFVLAAGGGRIDNATGTLTLSGGVTGTGYALTLGGAGDIILTNGIATSTGGSLVKKDAGKVTLSAANNYTGLTDIQTGTLALTGSGAIDSSPIINVASLAIFDVSGVAGGYTLGASQTLKGSGTVIGPMTAAGTVSPGSSTGTLTVTGNAALNGTFSVDVETGGASDLLAVTGNLTLGGASILSIVDTLQLNWDKKPYTIATYTGSLTGTFGGGNNLPAKWSVDYGVKTSQAITLVPEPATLVLLGLGGLGLLLGRKRR